MFTQSVQRARHHSEHYGYTNLLIFRKQHYEVGTGGKAIPTFIQEMEGANGGV